MNEQRIFLVLHVLSVEIEDMPSLLDAPNEIQSSYFSYQGHRAYVVNLKARPLKVHGRTTDDNEHSIRFPSMLIPILYCILLNEQKFLEPYVMFHIYYKWSIFSCKKR